MLHVSAVAPACVPFQPDALLTPVTKVPSQRSLVLAAAKRELREAKRSVPGPLGAALRDAIANQWVGQQTAGRKATQAAIAVRWLQGLAGLEVIPEAVTSELLERVTIEWAQAGTPPSSIAYRLRTLSDLGVDVQGLRRPKANRLAKPKRALQVKRKRSVPPVLSGPLSEVLKGPILQHWAGCRSRKRLLDQCRLVLADLERIGIRHLEEVSKAKLRALVSEWLQAGMAPATAIIRLNCAKAMGVDVNGCRPRLPNKPKWWCSPDQEHLICSVLEAHAHGPFSREQVLANYIRWTTRTGLRVEESLRLAWTDISTVALKDGAQRVLVSVPGTKTQMSQATIVLSEDAAEVLASIERTSDERLVFPVAYWELWLLWKRHRAVFGLPDPKVATLKALRRSAARHLHSIKGMPLDLVRAYLRHENVTTTMGYLRLTGGYNTEEMARWL